MPTENGILEYDRKISLYILDVGGRCVVQIALETWLLLLL